MANVNFLKGTSENFATLTKDANTFYFLTDAKELYLGENPISSIAQLAMLKDKIGTLTNLDTQVKSDLVSAINEVMDYADIRVLDEIDENERSKIYIFYRGSDPSNLSNQIKKVYVPVLDWINL